MQSLFAEGSIYITVHNSQGKDVYFKEYYDHFNGLSKTILTQEVDYSGKVLMTYEIDHAMKVAVELDGFSNDMYLSPDQDYELEINPEARIFKLIHDGKDSLNLFIEGIDASYEKMFRNNLVVGQNMTIEQQELIEKDLENVFNEYYGKGSYYFKEYFKYSFAEKSFDIARSNENDEVMDTILGNVINKSRIALDHPAYVSMIKHFSYHRYYTFFFDYNQDEMVNFKDQLKDYRTDTLRQLVLTHIIETGFKSDYQQKDLVLKWAKEALVLLHSPELVNILKVVLKKYYPFEEGQKAPDFELWDQYEQRYQFSKDQGSIKVLCFFATWNANSITDIKALTKLKKSFKDEVSFIGIIMDGTFEGMNRYIKRHDLEFHFVLGNEASFLDTYPMKNFPSYMVVGKDGVIIDPYAARPNKKTIEEIERYIKTH